MLIDELVEGAIVAEAELHRINLLSEEAGFVVDLLAGGRPSW